MELIKVLKPTGFILVAASVLLRGFSGEAQAVVALAGITMLLVYGHASGLFRWVHRQYFRR